MVKPSHTQLYWLPFWLHITPMKLLYAWMENTVMKHTFLKFDQSQTNSIFSIKTQEPQITQENSRSSEKSPAVAILIVTVCAINKCIFQALCVKAVTKKEWKRNKWYLMFNFPLTKKLATTQDRQILQNSDEKQDCQYWILLYMLVESATTFSLELHLGKRVYIGLTSWLTEGVVTILCFCAKLVFMLFIIGLS